jgi:type I restriction enzyme M protein
MTTAAKEQFLDSVPDFLDAVLTMEQALGRDSYDDWNVAWATVQQIAKEQGAKWTTANRKLFRQLFTVVDPAAQPVIARSGLREKVGEAPTAMSEAAYHACFGLYPDNSSKGNKQLEYEADPALRDFENVPLKEAIVTFFQREVQPFVPDAWIDRTSVDEQDGKIGKVGYEINFNRVFFRYQPPRPLAEIDAELKEVERRILTLLQEVTE